MQGQTSGVTAIELEGVSHRHDNGQAALACTDLRIDIGEFVCLVGPSGCGKTTLLRLMAGLARATTGRVRLLGREASAAQARDALSHVFQEPTLMPWATVAENVRLPLTLAGVPRAQADERVADALAQVGLGANAAQRPHELSGGMQMRVSIARGLVTRPRVLLMDEPFAALDELTRHRLDSELLQLWHDTGLTVVFVTHSLTEAAFLATRVLVMSGAPGRILHDERLSPPWPRETHHRTSADFNAQVRRLQDRLASTTQGLT